MFSACCDFVCDTADDMQLMQQNKSSTNQDLMLYNVHFFGDFFSLFSYRPERLKNDKSTTLVSTY
jgi:hypothetical protein